MAWSEWKDGSGGTLQIVSIPIVTGNSDSRGVRTFNATSIPNYENLTIENFFVVPYGIDHYWASSEVNNTANMRTDISYDVTTGILTVPAIRYYASGSNTNDIVIQYNVYCAYVA